MIKIKNEKVIYTSSQYHKFYINERILKNATFDKDKLESLIKIKLCNIIPSPIGNITEWFECSLFQAYCINFIKQDEYKEVINFFESASEKPNLLYLLQALQEYEMDEFEEIEHHTVDDIENVINLAYTTTESEKHEIQVDFNIEKLQWEEYIDGELKLTHKRNSIEEFNEEFFGLGFSNIISEILSMAEEMEEEENDD